jgi:hypothetical protein
VTLPPPAFSADGRHVFVRVVNRATGKVFMAIDGEARPEHDGLWIPKDMAGFPKVLRYVVRDGARLSLVETPWPTNLTWENPAKN